MIYRLILSPDAKAGVRSATRWYAQKDKDLPSQFKADLKAVLNRIALHPYQFPVVHAQFRRGLMKQFPYSVYFKQVARTVYVVRIAHQRQLSPWNRP